MEEKQISNRETVQESTLDDLGSYFESDEDVLGLLFFGSFSQPEIRPDFWSDIDVLVVVRDDHLDRFFPTVEWINHMGKIKTAPQAVHQINMRRGKSDVP
jgi:predicted nucleotidyltransferase